jgi:hypothetical protein
MIKIGAKVRIKLRKEKGNEINFEFILAQCWLHVRNGCFCVTFRGNIKRFLGDPGLFGQIKKLMLMQQF